MAEKIEELPKLVKDAAQRQYLSSDKLGAGGFATVFRAKMIDRHENLEASECALKVVRCKIKSEAMRTRFKFELGIHNKLRHPNIVEFYRAFTFEQYTYVSLELCLNGSLTDMVRRRKYLTMGEIRRFLIQLCGAVKYLHKRDVVHRDIKAGNVFLDEQMNVKLGDFGLASIMVPKDGAVSSYARRTTFCGTPNYLAPEILSRNGHDKSVDIWAIGILAYYLAVGRAPFHSKSKEEIYDRVRRADYAWPALDPDQNEIPEDLKCLVATLLVPEDRRPTPDQIVRDAFFARGFIPDKIDALARTRRPRWARAGVSGMADNSIVYDKLCRESHVGAYELAIAKPTKKIGSVAGVKRKHEEEPLMRTLEREFSAGVQLHIPMPEGVVYLAWRPAEKKNGVSRPLPFVPIAEDIEIVASSHSQESHTIQLPSLPNHQARPQAQTSSRPLPQLTTFAAPLPLPRPTSRALLPSIHPITLALETTVPPRSQIFAGPYSPPASYTSTSHEFDRALTEARPSTLNRAPPTRPLKAERAATLRAKPRVVNECDRVLAETKPSTLNLSRAAALIASETRTLTRSKRPRRAAACYE